MRIEVKVPVLAESVTDATLMNWRKKSGEFVHRDELLVELETDKVVLEVTAPEDGVLAEVVKHDGETAVSNELLAIIDTEAKASVKPVAAKSPAKASAPAQADAMLSPAARKLAGEHQIDANLITGTGKDGRITKEDVLSAIQQPKEQTAAPKSVQSAASAPAPAPAATPQPPTLFDSEDRPSKRVPMTRLRKRIAERLKDAQNTAACLTTFNEVNMQPVMDLRNRYKESFEKEYGTKLGFMSFFVKAAVEALKKFPVINASIDGDDIVYHSFFDIGVAVSSDRGLVVPVLRNADQLSFAEIEGSIIEYAQKAREGKLSMEELTGGTFTITNGGVFGSLLSTPILNPPQSAILGMHKTQARPVVENGQVVARPMMYLALTYDHRLIDGHEAVLFLVTLKQALEDPARMLLQI